MRAAGTGRPRELVSEECLVEGSLKCWDVWIWLEVSAQGENAAAGQGLEGGGGAQGSRVTTGL